MDDGDDDDDDENDKKVESWLPDEIWRLVLVFCGHSDEHDYTQTSCIHYLTTYFNMMTVSRQLYNVSNQFTSTMHWNHIVPKMCQFTWISADTPTALFKSLAYCHLMIPHIRVDVNRFVIRHNLVYRSPKNLQCYKPTTMSIKKLKTIDISCKKTHTAFHQLLDHYKNVKHNRKHAMRYIKEVLKHNR